MFTLSLERLQRSRHLEELESPGPIAPPRYRHIYFTTLYHLGMDGIRKLERVPRAFPKCAKIEIGEATFNIRPNLSHGVSSCSMSPRPWNTCTVWTVFMVT